MRGVASRGAMQPATKEEGEPAKVEAGQDGAPASAPAEALDSPSSPGDPVVPRISGTSGSSGAPRATLTPPPGPRCQPWCLLLALTFLLLFLLGSWAVVHLSLGTHGAPFQISASYDQRIPQDDTATIEPHFTTNCTMGESPVSSLRCCHRSAGFLANLNSESCSILKLELLEI